MRPIARRGGRIRLRGVTQVKRHAGPNCRIGRIPFVGGGRARQKQQAVQMVGHQYPFIQHHPTRVRFLWDQRPHDRNNFGQIVGQEQHLAVDGADRDEIQRMGTIVPTRQADGVSMVAMRVVLMRGHGQIIVTAADLETVKNQVAVVRMAGNNVGVRQPGETSQGNRRRSHPVA